MEWITYAAFFIGVAVGFAMHWWVERIPLFHSECDSAPIADADPPSDQFPVYERFPVVRNATGGGS